MKPLPDNKECLVTVILAVYNEESHLEECLDSLAAQDYPKHLLEVLAIDGGSTDGTREIVRKFGERHGFIRLLENPRRLAAIGWNIGIGNAKGDIIILMSGHAYVAEDFVSQNVKCHRENDIAACGGPVTGIGEDGVSTTIALACNSSFGVGNAHYRYLKKPAFVETVAYGAYRREIFDRIGLFDEELPRNADWEMNYRITLAGEKMLLMPTINSFLRTRSNLKMLWRQQYQTGFWKTRVARKHPGSLLARHLIPSLFVLTLTASLCAGVVFKPFLLLFAAVLGIYLAASLAVTVRISLRNKVPNPALLPPAFLVLHLGYGTGFLAGLLKYNS